jgi:uncharacterized membrane protein YbhN (UPF0104 family)
VISDSGPRWWQRRAGMLRVLLGAVVGLAIIAVLLHVRAEAARSSSALDSLRHADRPLVLVAILLETLSYVLPGLVLRRLVPELSLSAGLRITLASLGVGQLLPGNPATGSGIAFAELRRRQIPSRRVAPVSVALVIAVPAASMALLAAPALLASGIAGSLPAGWRSVVLIAGAAAALLATAVAVAVARGPREDRAGRAIAVLGSRRSAAVVLLLEAGSFVADAGCLWVTGRALHVTLPVASLPVAYVVGVAIVALPILPGGLGAVEVSLPAVFAAGGASYAQVVIVVLAWRVLSFWLPTAAGLGALASLHRPRRMAAAGT